ncbi:MAG TPA: hypothetical protein PK534_01515 [Chitinophagales bacterium]|nr:hypothetical protein [Chitinophagales bacterium]
MNLSEMHSSEQDGWRPLLQVCRPYLLTETYENISSSRMLEVLKVILLITQK